MKTLKSSIFMIVALSFWGILLSSCEKDEKNNSIPTENQIASLKSPYLICANRNPGGIGFDFENKEKKGGVNNLDSPTISDFVSDLTIKTIKGEKSDGNLGGAPYIKLSAKVHAINYSTIDTNCKGLSNFTNLNSSNIKSYTLQSDETSFNISTISTGKTGSPLMQQLVKEYNKLVIGMKWKEAANNNIVDDEPIWIIQTDEGKIIKFIVTGFPANPAPTSTGYIDIEWDFIN